MSHSFNRLIHETSPYLLQHAKNPVDWYPWGDEALLKAKDENKPILVSIGYSACHWCHVMEKESFEDVSTALLMNRYFICIKIDREERPDLDHFFMDALQAISGQGGWPLNMFLTSDAKPFYGGTYFPPVAIQNRISWKELLVRIHEAYRDRRTEIEEQASSLVAHLNKSSQIDEKVRLNFTLPKEEKFQRSQLEKIREQILAMADTVFGGFGRAPKFPQTFTISYLLRDYHFSENRQSLDQALLSIRKMLRGGIYDQVGGGFCRYATDTEWLAPHFEKMTYDNALLLLVLSDAFLITKDQEFKGVVEETIEFMHREMKCSSGGYYAALDADSENEEGKFYTWTSNEFDHLFAKRANAIKSFFDISDAGNWEGVNIPRLKQSLAEWAHQHGLTIEEAEQEITYAKKVLLDARSNRVRPGTDDKIILGWNALYLHALAKAGMAFSRQDWIVEAERGMEFLLSTFWDSSPQRWLHTHKNGISRFYAYLDDLSYLAQAVLSLYEASFDITYLEKGKEILQYIIDHFSDAEGLYFYYTANFQEDTLARKIDMYDGAIPSGNSVMAWNLYRYGVVYDEFTWRKRAENMVEGIKSGVLKYPNSFGIWASLVQELVEGTYELVIIGPDAYSFGKDIHKVFIPNKLIMVYEKSLEKFPMLNREMKVGQTLFYTCKDYTCSFPKESFDDWIAALLTKR